MRCNMYSRLTFLFIFIPVIKANYRKFGFHNNDLCSKGDKEKKVLQLGAGAALLTLDNIGFSDSQTFSKCSVTIKADRGFGLMVYIEEMSLRTARDGGRKSSCVDSVQFGRDDVIPFFTIHKSEPLCGNKTGFHYDEPGGKLLVWLYLGAASGTMPNDITTNRLTVVITAYKKGRVEDPTHFRMCTTGDRMVRKEYFCDWRVNCALDKKPGDERPEVCRHNRGTGAGGKGVGDPPGEWHPPLNLVSITLVLVSLVVLLVLVLLLVARMRRSGCLCYKRQVVTDCELPEHLSGLSRQTAAHMSGGALRIPTNEGHENVYLPLTMYAEPRHDHRSNEGRRSNTTPDTEPPPAYHDLFPVGYKFEPEKQEDSSHNLVGSATKTDGTDPPSDNQASLDGSPGPLTTTQATLPNHTDSDLAVVEAAENESRETST